MKRLLMASFAAMILVLGTVTAAVPGIAAAIGRVRGTDASGA
jgi:hypothetical protein